MANEAIKFYDESSGDGSVVQDYTVADGVGISKGALLKITDGRTAVLSDGAGDVLAGIAKRDKVASDGRTKLSVYKKGYFQMTASGAVTVGDTVQSAGDSNKIETNASATGAKALGYAEETNTDGPVLVRVDL